MMFEIYDVIVVGAGHAGCEAAAAAARLGAKTLMLTMNMNTIAQMSCNPAMGGTAKGQLVREIDAMGGQSGVVTDETMIQFRMLNRSKGPAMWSPRAQSDRAQFAAKWREILEKTEGLDFWQEMAVSLLLDGNKVTGVKTSMGIEIRAKAVILTNGTFLNGIIHIGEKRFGGGRAGESAATGLTEQLQQLGFESGRMKTGTPPRLDGRTINWEKLEIQHGDENPDKFSFLNTSPLSSQIPCHIAYTNKEVHEILESGFEKSPMFSGRIQGQGPRYCPSIEDKIVRFSGRDRHQLFVEPEGRKTVEVYLNGFSSSLPEDVQFRALRKIDGLENVKMFRPGYAIEYDYFPPTQISATLETRLVEGLFFAGQINGTTGYEEAAAQGLMAGINAARRTRQLKPIILERNEAYIGVLIDDLVNKGTNEPYRMFTSRAEYRIMLRQDNADLRLTSKGYEIGLASAERREAMEKKRENVAKVISNLRQISISPDEADKMLQTIDNQPMTQKMKADKVLLRPGVTIKTLAGFSTEIENSIKDLDDATIQQAEITLKYEGYIRKEQELADKMIRLDQVSLPQTIDYKAIHSLSNEGKEKLSITRPRSLGQASRISGVSPADISVLMVYIGR